MKTIIKFAGIAFLLQLVIIGIAVFFLEAFGIESFWRLLLVLYISPTDSILRFLLGNPKAAGGMVMFFAGLVPLTLYSLLIAFVFSALRKSREN